MTSKEHLGEQEQHLSTDTVEILTIEIGRSAQTV